MKLADLVKEYVAHKRSLGMRFGTQASTLGAFCRAAGSTDADRVQQASVLAFLPTAGVVTSSWHQKLSTLRGLYRFATARGYANSSPLPLIVPKKVPYARPYIFSPDELRRLLAEADNADEGSLKPFTFRTLLLLLYGAGLRISEAVGLSTADVDLSSGLLIVRNTKFSKTRWVPIGPRLADALRAYAQRRPTLSDRPMSTSAFFVRRQGTAVTSHAAEVHFRPLCDRAGVRRSDGAHFQPRLHDLRHTFAVNRLVSWYRAGADVQRLLPKLATYLGHKGIAETQHYLTMTPELLREANRRFERFALPEVHHDR